MRFVIPAVPPSNNQFIGRNMRWQYQDVKKRWAELIWLCCRPRPNEPLKGVTVHITYYFPDRRRRDPDNYSGKMILDGLTKSNIIADDSFDCITLKLSACVDKNNSRTEIVIE